MSSIGNLLGSVLSLPFSFLILLSYFLFKKLHSSSNRIILSLAVADILFNILSLIQYGLKVDDESNCYIVGFLINSTMLALAMLSCWLARYLKKCLISMHPKKITKVKLIEINLKILLSSMVLSACPIIVRYFTKEGGYTVMNRRCQIAGDDEGGRWQRLVFLYVVILLCLADIAYNYYKIDQHFNNLVDNLNEVNSNIQRGGRKKMEIQEIGPKAPRRPSMHVLRTSLQSHLENSNAFNEETTSSLEVQNGKNTIPQNVDNEKNTLTSLMMKNTSFMLTPKKMENSNSGSSTMIKEKTNTSRRTSYTNPVSKDLIKKLATTIDTLKLFPVVEFLSWIPLATLFIIDYFRHVQSVNVGDPLFQILLFLSKSSGLLHGLIFLAQPRTRACWKDFIEKSCLYDRCCGPKAVAHARDKKPRWKGSTIQIYLDRISFFSPKKEEKACNEQILEIPATHTAV